MFHLGQIERTGRRVHACHQYIERTPTFHHGGDGKLHCGSHCLFGLWISGRNMFTFLLRLCRNSSTGSI